MRVYEKNATRFWTKHHWQDGNYRNLQKENNK